MAETKEALRKHKLLRSQCKATITRIETFVNDPISFASATVDILEARKEKLITALKAYETVQLDILSMDEGDAEQVGLLEEKYYSILAKINASLKLISKKSVSECHNVSTCKLPNIDICPYDGKDYTKYRPFYDLFMAIIDNNRSLSDVQKLFYLRKYLTDDALAVIVNLPLVNQSYREALQLLNKRFDNRARIITNHINVLLDLPVMQKGTAASIRSFVSEVQQQLHALKNLNEPIDTWDMLLISILTRKLDQITNRAYQLDRDSDKMPSMADFMQFLEKRAIALEDSLPPKSTSYESTYNNNKYYKPITKVTNVATQLKKPCKFCNKNEHPLFSCPEYKTAALEDRQIFVRDNELCSLCLKPHSGKCKFNFKCKICRQGHNTLLHQEQPNASEPAVTLVSNPVSNNILLPTVKVDLLNSNGERISVRALLDTGSQASFVTSNLVQKLGLISINQPNNIIGIGNKQTKINQCVNLNVLSCQQNVKFNLKCHVVDTITTKLPQQFINISGWNLPKNVKLSDDEFNVPAEISLLLGADIYFSVLLEGCIKIHNGPVLQNTMFGYVVGGSIPENACNNVSSNNNDTCQIVTNFAIHDHNKLENIMENFWLSEKLPEPVKPKCNELVKAEEIFQGSLVMKDNRFSVDMPLIASMEELQLGDSFSVAYQRFLILEKRFKTNPLLLEQYKLFIDQYVELGHAKVVDIANYDLDNDPVYFLAHHAVINEASKTTPVRVVFDGSMKSRSKVSLNEVMLNGPVVQSELFDILILFRTYLFTLVCDIQKMFRQVSINGHQTCLQNILWRDDPKKPITCLQLQTVTYGLKASTFLATRCLIELASRYKNSFPMAAQTMETSTYVDDVLSGADNVEQLQKLKRELVELLKLGSFSLHKWCSNSIEVLNDIPNEQKHFENIDLSGNNLIKTLGLMYNITSDTFTFSSPNIDEEQNLNTKRKILSFIGKMFDPLGVVGPITVLAKIFMQELWSLQIGWDSTVPHNQLQCWNNYLQKLKQMGTIVVNRCVSRENRSSAELLGYSDASIKAFGCCLYIRILKKDGSWQTELLCSKSRVAPLNRSLTIPQLELNSALLLAQLVHRVGKVLKKRFPHLQVFLYSDSQIVLAWIKSGNVKSNIYAYNRVKQIGELTEHTQWGYVKTKDNPADLLSRGVLPHKLQENSLWWHGPKYLSDSSYIHTSFEKSENLDLLTTVLETKDEQDLQCNLTKVESSFAADLFKKYSSINKLQKVIGFIYRFYNNCSKNKNKITDSNLTPQELRASLSVIVRCTQREHFSVEIKTLSAGKNIKIGIGNLHPFIDHMGILRVGGRLQNARQMSFDKKHPIILPKHSHITNLLIEKEHLRLLHAGPKLVLSSLSQRYSIVSGIREVKKVVHKCVKCARWKAKAAKQLMGSLPWERITTSRPFQHVGVDFCGPFEMKVARIRKPIKTKCYIALFVCFAIKAIHVELVSDLTTEAFLACLKRFIARRGMPTNIFCDNAQTFKSSSNIMKKLYDLQSSKDHRDAVHNFSAQNYIKFNFIPSYSPEFGGLWEAGVKSVKFHLKKVVSNICLTYEELYTVIVQIEGILNSRPLLSVNSNDCQYLTPGHFLIGTALTSYPEIDITNASVNTLKFWNLCTKLKQDFWKLWSNDYLTQLQSRPKWKYLQPNLKEGDLVIVKNPNTTPLVWPMARIVKTYPGSDGRVRVADIKMNSKVYRRSINRLCPLPID